ncbi:SIS domain-containing protein [Vagococcus zengguangii]|uniref:SIS domain-containing protein n=1 Tax=Vagococcus zengguangii TaxID=2571750 RepID=A0A4D7CTG9_9ENTE|nr:SIS domain-containing protein [Vagococcus zengguangii]QCI85721.1 SIS domain-containing protein [Vagococcus zengguangii]TLG81662.1 SIS domain-containing protein [Vagococcus zengguangii]
MFFKTDEELTDLGALITTREIEQQPKLWQETFDIYQKNQEEINKFINDFAKESQQKVRVVFTGAGTSAYVGDVVKPHLVRYGDNERFIFEAIPTTDIVAAPYDYLKPEEPTILVSFARSGNSPESVATVDIANQVVKNLRHLIITCAPEGQLAQSGAQDDKAFVMLMPALSNDKGFAMTGSFTCMTLASLLVFDDTHTNKAEMVEQMSAMGEQGIKLENEIKSLVDLEFNRVVYLGSGALSGLTREAQLKLLELTAGQVTTAFDSSLGFRHGPKSFVDEKTLVFTFISNDAYTAQYDVDILEEIKGNEIAVATVGIAQNTTTYSGQSMIIESEQLLPDAYLALPYIVIAQTFALLTSVKVENKPDTPSPTGTVNRVVQGVIIHELNK